MSKNREKEVKLIVSGYSFIEDVSKKIADIFSVDKTHILNGSGWDYFYNSSASVLRLRVSYGDRSPELTLKQVDRGNNFDRLEVNIFTKNTDIKDIKKFMYELFGEPIGKTHKTYIHLKVENAIISVYKTYEVPEIFLEIESNDTKEIILYWSVLNRHFNLRREHRSLAEIVCGEKNV